MARGCHRIMRCGLLVDQTRKDENHVAYARVDHTCSRRSATPIDESSWHCHHVSKHDNDGPI